MREDPGFSIEADQVGEGVVVRPRGELDLATSPELEQLVLGHLRDGVDVVLDLRGLQFMDSSGVRVLVTATATAAGAGEQRAGLRIVRPPAGSAVERIITVSGIGASLPFVDDGDAHA